MSIVTSRQERDEAVAGLEGLPVATLEQNLIYWELAALESGQQFHDVGERLAALRDLHAEEGGWIRLHAEELHRRRVRQREEART